MQACVCWRAASRRPTWQACGLPLFFRWACGATPDESVTLAGAIDSPHGTDADGRRILRAAGVLLPPGKAVTHAVGFVYTSSALDELSAILTSQPSEVYEIDFKTLTVVRKYSVHANAGTHTHS